jgi:hypothetical protein
MNFQIPEPCSQKWEQMAFMKDNTRFCAECSRKIVDFTNQSDRQILQHLWSNSTKICGKFSSNQLNRNLSNPQFHFPGLKALLVMGSLATFSNEIHSQVTEVKSELIQTYSDTTYQIILGNVRDTAHSNGIQDIYVELPHFNLFSELDSIGNFKFSIPVDNFPDQITLIVRKGNAYKVYKELNPREFIQIQVSLHPIEIDVNFIKETQLIGYVVVKPKWYQFGFEIRRWWYRAWN